MALHTPKENRPNKEWEEEMKTPVTDNGEESLAEQTDRLQSDHIEYLRALRGYPSYAEATRKAQLDQSCQRIFANSTPGNMTNPVDKTQNPFNSLGRNPASVQDGFYLQNNFGNIGQNDYAGGFNQNPQQSPQFNSGGYQCRPSVHNSGPVKRIEDGDVNFSVHQTSTWKVSSVKDAVDLSEMIEFASVGTSYSGNEEVSPNVCRAFGKIKSLINVFPRPVFDTMKYMNILRDKKQLVIHYNKFNSKTLSEVLEAFLALEPEGTEWSFKGHLYQDQGFETRRYPTLITVTADNSESKTVESYELYTEIKD